MTKKAKKRGVKPGTKRGSYRKPGIVILSRKQAIDAGWKVSENQVGPTKILTLCGQLEDAVMNLETRISNSIAKINSLM